MMRHMLNFRLGMIAAVILLLLLIIFLPLRVALGSIYGSNLVTAREASGTVWSGKLHDARLGPFSVGSVNGRLAFWPLLLGRTRLMLERPAAPDATAFSGTIASSGSQFALAHITATVPVDQAFAQLPIRNLQFVDFNSEFSGGQCRSASGSVRIMLAASLPGFDLPQGLLGTARCEKGSLLLPLVSQTGLERLEIAIRADRSYTADLILAGARPDIAPALTLSGFTSIANGYRLRRTGKF